MRLTRRGRHTTPSPATVIAAQAGTAASVAALAGAAAVTGPQLALTASAQPHAVEDTGSFHAIAATDTAYVTHSAKQSTSATYTVKPGDTLSGIARSHGTTWQAIYADNRNVISNPNLINPGERLVIGAVNTAYVPKHAAPAPVTRIAGVTHTVSSSSPSGTLSCSGLETLWRDAGGNPGEAFTAAEIAMAESGGNQFAVSPTADYGYWQINRPAHGAQATFDPIGNARAAISISSDGSNWNPWTTYRTGAYRGKC